MQQADIILGLLFPANQDSTKSVHPAVCSFRDPAACFESRRSSNQFGFLPARTNVRRKSEFLGQIAHLGIVIPFVQAQVLRFAQRGSRPFDGNAGDRRPRQLEIVDVGSAHGQSDRDPVALDQKTSLGA